MAPWFEAATHYRSVTVVVLIVHEGSAMLFAVICSDRPAALDLRMATRPQHLAYLESWTAKLVHAGALLDAEAKPCGSLLVVDVADRAEAEGFAAADPYAKAGLFESTVIRPFRPAFKDGVKLG
jgi:uncharacterized protein